MNYLFPIYKFVTAAKWNKYVNIHSDSLPGGNWKQGRYTIDVIVFIGIQPRCGCNIRPLSTTEETVVIGIEPLRGCNKCYILYCWLRVVLAI